ncbi:MAG: HipA N-terminal domain-containing protein [Bacteroidales bacterium]|nr:HipA N-terminal domain-containing protein [Bacteroidales bacterium]
MRSIKVYCMGQPAGVLQELPGGQCRFTYDEAYLSDESLPPVSVILPKSSREYCGDALLPYFQSILPEGRNRKVFCSVNRIDEDDWFGMLCALAGRDIPGAVTLENHQL